MLKKQIIIIHGGGTFASYKDYIIDLKNTKINFERVKNKGWKDAMGKDLGRGFEVILPKMPNSSNAKYAEWKIWWEKIIPHLEREVVLVGHSLGGIFLAKYLSENKFLPKSIKNSLPPLNLPLQSTGRGERKRDNLFLRLRKGRKKEDEISKKILATFLIAAPYDDKDGEDSLADFELKKDLSLLEKQSEKLFIWQSTDDDVVPFADFEKYKKALPDTSFREFKNKGHFTQSNFSELVKEIKRVFNNLSKNRKNDITI